MTHKAAWYLEQLKRGVVSRVVITTKNRKALEQLLRAGAVVLDGASTAVVLSRVVH